MAPEGPTGADIVVFQVRRRDGQCDGCSEALGKGRWIRIVAGPRGERRAHCMKCAGLDHLVMVPTGDAALTRRAKKLSKAHAVVVQWARARKRYERQGWLVEEPALQEAMAQLRAEGHEPAWRLVGDVWVRER